MIAAEPGLCATCHHARLVVSGKGSRFVLCERSRTDPAFPRYPRLPVLACLGFEPAGRPDPDTPTGDLDARDGSNLDSADI
ncbi:MAG TPA: hypothetical protein VFJ71_01265 [Candidatus Limnocylindrales bacterium]|nr:hypothetical protein [Candidatus Limnocylindrales bacterium]